MVTQFARPAAPPGYVARPRLEARLREGLEGPVTLVCGPPGSGKTTLLAAVLDPDAAWVSLEPGDDQPGGFWDAVLTGLRASGAAPDGSALAALAAPVGPGAFVPLLVNALAE